MLKITDKAGQELRKVLESDAHKDKQLILYFMGAGWSGPTMGMALDESTDGLVELTSNGITTYIDPKLNEYLSQLGDLNIDYITNETGSGYSIRIGDGACGPGPDGCAGCSGASS